VADIALFCGPCRTAKRQADRKRGAPRGHAATANVKDTVQRLKISRGPRNGGRRSSTELCEAISERPMIGIPSISGIEGALPKLKAAIH